MLKPFSRKTQRRQLAPQLTLHERRTLAQPGAVPPGGLPYSAYDQMQTDSMVQTALTLKKLGVVAAPWRIVPADTGPRAAAHAGFVEEAFSRMEGSASTILVAAMDAFAKGWSIQESVYEWSGGRVWLQAVRPKNPSYFGIEADAYARITGLTLRLPGEAPLAMPRDKFVIYRNRGEYGDIRGRSDLDAAYRHWQSKQAMLSAWRLHLERFAMPTVLAKVARGVPSDEQSALLGSLDNLNKITALLYPEEIEIGTLGGEKEPSAGFMDAIEFHNREIARAILGQTLTTDEGRRVGSLAMGKVHLQVMLLQLEALRKELADQVINEQVIRPLVEMNFGPVPLPRLEFEQQATKAFVSGEI